MNLKEIFKDALPIISRFAPSVGAAIGGPFGAAAGAAIPLLASTFDTQTADLKGLVSKIISDPDAESKLKSCEIEHLSWANLLDEVHNLTRAEINIKLEWEPEKYN